MIIGRIRSFFAWIFSRFDRRSNLALRRRVSLLEEMAHPPREFIVCDVCKRNIKEK